MKRTWLAPAVLAFSCAIVGCDNGETKPSAEETKPDFGQASGDRMKNEIGVPGKGGSMQPAKPAAK